MRLQQSLSALGIATLIVAGCAGEPSPDIDPTTGNYVGTGDDRRLRSTMNGYRREDGVQRDAEGRVNSASVNVTVP